MTTQVTDVELEAAMAQIMAEQAVWFASRRAELAAKAAKRKRELDSRIRAINAVGRYLDEFAVQSGAFGG